MPRLASLDEIEALYAAKGALNYGENITQAEHAVQCAILAQEAGAAPSLVAAALLHDVGHLFDDEAEVVANLSDGRHEITGAQALKDLFDEAVRGPIALHVPAKRYLCRREPGYWDALSDASKASLEVQGGPFGDEAADAFERLPHWREAVELRRYDDIGKREDLSGRAFAEFMPLLRSLAR